MSVAGLRFGHDRSSAPLETKSGSYIYYGDAANYHDWEFRTLLRIKLFDSKKEVVSSPSASSEPARPDPDVEAGISPHPRPGRRDEAASAESSPKGDDAGKDRSTLVNKIVEGLRGDAFLIARDLGLETLTQDGGLERLVERIKSHVFPRAQEEAKELFRAGQKAVLSRQLQEPMLSYTQRRRSLWRVLTELDPSMSLSDGLRMELMLELSGLSRREVLVVKACATTKDFEGVAKVLVDQYSGIHLREGSKSWVGRTTPQSGKPGKGYGNPKGSYGGKGSYKTAYNAYPEWEGYEEGAEGQYEEYYEEDAPYTGLLGGIEESTADPTEPDADSTAQAFDLHDDVDDFEATALNALADLGDADDDKNIGDAIQLQLAAFAAFNRAKGKGKGKPKGKGKVIRSNLSIEQRRKRLEEIKAKSKCLRCGGYGHWAGDPACKFPGAKGSSSGPKGNQTTSNPKPTAHFADFSDSSSDDGVFLNASSPKTPVANMAVKRAATPKTPSLASAPVRFDDPSKPLGSETKFKVGQFKGKTFWEILHGHPDYFAWTLKNAKSPGASEYAEWVNKHFEYRGSMVFRRNSWEDAPPIPKGHTRMRKPPYPPKEKCAECKHFTRQGSTVYTIKETCLVCGNATTTRRDWMPMYPFQDCPHEDTDSRGSSRSVHRTFCKQCCTFLDETPMELQKTRREVSKKVLDAPLDKVAIVDQVVDESKETTFSPEMLESILAEFTAQVATCAESEAVTSSKLHEILHKAIADAEGDNSFTVVGDDMEPSGDFAGLGICFHGDEPEFEMSDGLVHVFQETRDMYDLSDPNIHVVLDEGCNSTCHSSGPRWLRPN